PNIGYLLLLFNNLTLAMFPLGGMRFQVEIALRHPHKAAGGILEFPFVAFDA
ncbi:unnamed protein product, partial [marine sediment metagenome]